MKDGKEWLSYFQIFYSLVEGKGVAYMKKKLDDKNTYTVSS